MKAKTLRPIYINKNITIKCNQLSLTSQCEFSQWAGRADGRLGGKERMRYQVVCSVQATVCLSLFIKTQMPVGSPHRISGSELECASSTSTLERHIYNVYIPRYVYICT